MQCLCLAFLQKFLGQHHGLSFMMMMRGLKSDSPPPAVIFLMMSLAFVLYSSVAGKAGMTLPGWGFELSPYGLGGENTAL
jgi:hypothetical protein